MREILFRGKRKDNGEWVEGFYFQKPNPFSEDGLPVTHAISDIPPFGYDVDPETIGQYTGLNDKNGKKIFEGDIVHCVSKFDSAYMVVIFECGQFRMVLAEKYHEYQTNIGYYDINCFAKEVIGNIHDNKLEDF